MKFKFEFTGEGESPVTKATIHFNATHWQAAAIMADDFKAALGPGTTVVVYDEPMVSQHPDAISPGLIIGWMEDDRSELSQTTATPELEDGVVHRRFTACRKYEQGEISRTDAMADLIGSGLLPEKAVRRLDAIDFQTTRHRHG